jgi:putative exporter of polyketide antibiotics
MGLARPIPLSGRAPDGARGCPAPACRLYAFFIRTVSVLTLFLRHGLYTSLEGKRFREVIGMDLICLGVAFLFFGLSFGMVGLLERLQ